MTAWQDFQSTLRRARRNHPRRLIGSHAKATLEISGYYDSREHLGTEPVPKTRRELLEMIIDYSCRFPYHEDAITELVMRDRLGRELSRNDVTDYLTDINLGD